MQCVNHPAFPLPLTLKRRGRGGRDSGEHFILGFTHTNYYNPHHLGDFPFGLRDSGCPIVDLLIVSGPKSVRGRQDFHFLDGIIDE